MQALAREFNLSETVFVLPPTTGEATYRLRIFTPGRELPFAGHPSVGAAVTQLRAGLFKAGDVVQECGAGLLPMTVSDGGTATLTGGTPTVGPELDPAPLLAMVGLTADDYAGPAPRVAGCGLEFPYLSVHPDALARAAGDPRVARQAGYVQVSVFAYGLHEDTVRAWLERGGQQAQRVQEHLVHNGAVDEVHVQADELWVRLRRGRVWPATGARTRR